MNQENNQFCDEEVKNPSQESPGEEENKEASGQQASETTEGAEQNSRAQEPESEATDSNSDEPKASEDTVDYKDRWLRVTAEYQNYRTRTQKEKEEIYQNANAKFIEELLEVIDNFERAMQAKQDGDKFDEGIELIYKQFLGILEKNHVKEIPAKGEKFDPVFHMAVQMMAVEGMESDMVAEVIKKGYTLNDKVIRPAMVVVSQ